MTELDDQTLALLTDYVEGTLPPDQRTELEARLAADPALQAEVDEMREAQVALKRLDKAPAPTGLGKQVEDTIHRRSAGRFFGKKTLGDRVPFGYLLIPAVLVLVFLAYVLWSSSTGSLRGERDVHKPPPHSKDVIPKPDLSGGGH